jgi:5-methylcytosine-specific restriction endonuclease McrA
MANFKPQVVGAGVLFAQASRTTFNDLTRSRYQGMVDRLKKKKLPALTFSLEEFRTDIRNVMGGVEDGAIMCRFCRRWFTLSEIAVDHSMPLSRGGSPNLTNIDYPCKPCNSRKGSLTTQEYAELVLFLEGKHPLMMKDVLSRLEKANALAAGARRAQMLQAQLKKPAAGRKDEEVQDDMPDF